MKFHRQYDIFLSSLIHHRRHHHWFIRELDYTIRHILMRVSMKTKSSVDRRKSERAYQIETDKCWLFRIYFKYFPPMKNIRILMLLSCAAEDNAAVHWAWCISFIFGSPWPKYSTFVNFESRVLLCLSWASAQRNYSRNRIKCNPFDKKILFCEHLTCFILIKWVELINYV